MNKGLDTSHLILSVEFNIYGTEMDILTSLCNQRREMSIISLEQQATAWKEVHPTSLPSESFPLTSNNIFTDFLVPPAPLSTSPHIRILLYPRLLQEPTLFSLVNSKQWWSFPVGISPKVICVIFVSHLYDSYRIAGILGGMGTFLACF